MKMGAYAPIFLSTTETHTGAGAVTLIQRFGNSLNIYIQLLFVDIAHISGTNEIPAQFRWVKALTAYR